MKTLESRLEDFNSFMTLKNFSPNTKGMYLRTIRMFLEFRKTRKIRGRLKQEDARIFLLHRIEAGRSWSTINCDYSALRKYFREVEELSWSLKKIPRPRKENTLPKILSKEDVVKLIEHAPTYKYQVFLTFMYTTGLRMSEALNLRMQDIDSDRLQIRIEKGKGSKDRYILIPKRLVALLRSYYKVYRPKEYLFNGLKAGKRYSAKGAQWSIKRARELAKIQKSASLHTLRHCYATHHIESGTDLVYLQEQMGHKHLKTTARYVQLCMEQSRHINHPIDHLEIQYRKDLR